MGAERRTGGQVAGWVLVAVGATLTLLAFVDRRPSRAPFAKHEPELLVRAVPVAKNFTFVKAPYPFDRQAWPYERLPGGQLQLREGAE